MITHKKKIWLTILATLGVCFLAGAVFISTAQAQESPPSPNTSCMACHENLYYLHDTGNWFCQCAEQMTCTCCHGGDPEALTEKEAHAGMNLYPTRQDASACRECHPNDYEARVDHFARVAGISPYHPVPTTTGPVTTSPADSQPTAGSASRLQQPWRLTGLILVGIAMIGVVAFGYRCWRADCIAKIKK